MCINIPYTLATYYNLTLYAAIAPAYRWHNQSRHKACTDALTAFRHIGAATPRLASNRRLCMRCGAIVCGRLVG